MIRFFYIGEYRTYKQIEKKLSGALNIRESPGYNQKENVKK